MIGDQFDFYEIRVRKERERIEEIKKRIEEFAKAYPIRTLLAKTESISGNTQYRDKRSISHYLVSPEEISPIFLCRDWHGHNNDSGAGEWTVTVYCLKSLDEKIIKESILKLKTESTQNSRMSVLYPDWLKDKYGLFEIKANRRADYLSNWARKGPPTRSLPNGGSIKGRDDLPPRYDDSYCDLEWSDAIDLVHSLPEGEEK
jgi:hypothetical protein